MAVWTVTGVGQDGEAFLGCKIVRVPESRGDFTFLIFTPNGDLPIISSTSNPPSFTGFNLGGLTWNVSTTGAIPRNPPGGYTLAGFYSNSARGARPESGTGSWGGTGSWQAEATGGGPLPLEGEDDSEESEEDKSDEDDAQ